MKSKIKLNKNSIGDVKDIFNNKTMSQLSQAHMLNILIVKNILSQYLAATTL